MFDIQYQLILLQATFYVGRLVLYVRLPKSQQQTLDTSPLTKICKAICIKNDEKTSVKSSVWFQERKKRLYKEILHKLVQGQQLLMISGAKFGYCMMYTKTDLFIQRRYIDDNYCQQLFFLKFIYLTQNLTQL